MPGPVTYAAIALMARDRLRLLRDALGAKVAGGRVVNDLERQVGYLAGKAHDLLSAHHPSVASPARLYGPGLADQVSKFALLGAVGPELPGYAAMFAPGQGWIRDLLHKGTPDANRERVVARSCDFAFNFWRIVQPLVQAEFRDSGPRDSALQAMQAYVLGHFCHLGADLVGSPFIDNLQWRLGDAARPALSREAIIGAIETEVSRRLFHRGTQVRGNDWGDWWPGTGQVPGSFYEGFKRAIEDTYVLQGVPLGLPGWNKQHADDNPPPLSAELLKEGYANFRTVLDVGAAWDYWDWMEATWFMFLPSVAMLPLAAALPNGRHHLLPPERRPAGYDDDKAKFELIALPFAVNALVPIYYQIIATTSYLGAESQVVFGWVSAGIQLAAAIAFFASLDASSDSLAARWPLLFGLPLLMQVIHVIVMFVRGARNPRRMQLLVSVLLPMFLSLLFLGLWWAFLHEGVEKLDSDGGEFAWRFAVWVGLLVGLWFGIAALLRHVFAPSLTDPAANPIVGNQRHHIRLFDDTTLYMAPRGNSPTLADQFFASGRRELLKLWWTGANPPSLVVHRDRLEFRFGAAAPQFVRVPMAPVKLSEFAATLERNVKDGAANAFLRAKIFHGETAELELEDYELPPGLAFADAGDAETTQAAHDAKAGQPQPLQGNEATAVVVFHAPKVHQSVRFERSGPTLDQEQRTAAAAGVGLANSAAGARTVTVGGPPAGFTRLTLLFKPGDIIEAPIGGARRVVVSVDSETQLTVSTPFPGGLAGTTFGRAARVFAVAPGGLVENPPAAGWTAQAQLYQANLLQGAGPAGFSFGALFRPGDTIRIQPAAGPVQDRQVVEIVSDTQIVVSRPLDPPLASRDSAATPPLPPPAPTTPFVRLVTEASNLFTYVAGSDDVLGDGDALMNEAADLATLLCLGATSHLIGPVERGRIAVGTANDMDRVFQVFRNWNLDRRRVNEWQMLVGGGAVSEKRGNPTGEDAALPPLPAGWTLFAPGGEAVANQLGWVGLLRSWFDMARRPEVDSKAAVAFRPGDPTNLELSRGLAFLLDARDPVPTP